MPSDHGTPRRTLPASGPFRTVLMGLARHTIAGAACLCALAMVLCAPEVWASDQVATRQVASWSEEPARAGDRKQSFRRSHGSKAAGRLFAINRDYIPIDCNLVSDAGIPPRSIPSPFPVRSLAEAVVSEGVLVLNDSTDTARSASFYEQQELSLDPMPLGVFWGKLPAASYTPQELASLQPQTETLTYLEERFKRVELSREEGKKLKAANASFRYALRQIMAKQVLKDKVFLAERLVNQFRYFSEPTHEKNGVLVAEDHWMTPSEFLDPKHGGYSGGDCEDFALYKYVLLEQAGVDPRQMKIVALEVPSRSELKGHAVLTVEDPAQGIMYVLDSLKKAGQSPVHYNTTYLPQFYISHTHIAGF